MAVPGLKYNDSSGVLTANCFPVRSFLRQGDDGGGAWLVAHKAEQRRRFKAVLCAKPLTYDAIHEQRQRTDKAGNTSVPPPTIKDEPHGGEEHEKSLDGFFLMKHCCIEDPSHLCSVNISGQNLTDAKHDDFIMFDNVAYVNAAENILPFECFKHFPILRELEQPLNALMNLKLSPDDFPHLQMCDLSYNNLTSRDLLSLGLLPELKVLHVMGNSLSKIPNDLAHPFEDEFNDNYQLRHRFTKLEVLMLDDNNLSDINTFSALAGLPRLKQLHLSKNNIYSVPHLMVVENNVIKEQSTVNTPGRKSGRKSSRRSRSYMSQLSRQRSKMISVVSDAEAEQGSHSHRQVTVSGSKLVSSSANHEIDSTVLSNVPPNSTVLSSSSSQIYAQNPEANKEPAITEVQEENLLDTDLSKPPELPEEILMTPPPDHYASDENAALPFPRLQYLNLSHNKIREEEGLLAVAVWPMLNELVIHDNPLTTQTSGDPPLLKRFLKNQFGIQITRLKPKEIEKPHIEVAPKEDRKVSSQVPRIPKVTVDELLALEAAMTQPALPPTEETTPRKALPPVKSPTISPKPIPTEQTTATESDENTFFMTQMDEQPIREIKTERKDGQVAELKTERIKRKHHRVKVPEKYKGYEDIITLDDEHDESLPVPSDLNGNVKALQYALNHSLIYKDPEQVELQRPQPPHRLIYKPTPPKSKPMISHREKIDGVLENLKTRETFLETGLAEVFKHPQKYSKSFSDADKLLQQVQKKYNFVRTSSMHESAVDAKTLLEETKQMAQTLKP